MELPLTVGVAATESALERFERLLGPEIDRAYQLAGYLLGMRRRLRMRPVRRSPGPGTASMACGRKIASGPG